MSSIDPSKSHLENLSDPIYDVNLVKPIDQNQFTSNWVSNLYIEEQLTQDEYVLLDFLGVNQLARAGEVIISFQGLKREISIHQARLTKAINRLIEKNLLQKTDIGYALTRDGSRLFEKLFSQYGRTWSSVGEKLYVNVATGTIQGPKLTSSQISQIERTFAGKWFGKYRFLSKIDYDGFYEICWMSTNGSIYATLRVGPNNSLKLSLSASIQSIAQSEIQLLKDYIEPIIEQSIDAPVVFTNYTLYENKNKTRTEVEDALYYYAG